MQKGRNLFVGMLICVVGMVGLAGTAMAVKPCTPNGIVGNGEGCDPVGPVFRGDTSCQTEGFDGGTLACTATCQVDTSGCVVTLDVVFPGDGVTGPALSYTDNGDGTIADNNTQLVWEKKDDLGGVHDKDNTYTWTDGGDSDFTDPDGTLFTDFLSKLNTTCEGAGVTLCTAGCGSGVCGLAGHTDWRIPNVKEVQSIVDYSKSLPGPTTASTFPGLTAASVYWSSTSDVYPFYAWGVSFYLSYVNSGNKSDLLPARAVRGGS